MSYRLVAKKRGHRRYESSLILYRCKIESRKYDLTATTVTSYKFCAFLSSFLTFFIFENILAFFKCQFLKKLTHLFTLSFYTDIINMWIFWTKTCFLDNLNGWKGVKTLSSMKIQSRDIIIRHFLNGRRFYRINNSTSNYHNLIENEHLTLIFRQMTLHSLNFLQTCWNRGIETSNIVYGYVFPDVSDFT